MLRGRVILGHIKTVKLAMERRLNLDFKGCLAILESIDRSNLTENQGVQLDCEVSISLINCGNQKAGVELAQSIVALVKQLSPLWIRSQRCLANAFYSVGRYKKAATILGSVEMKAALKEHNAFSQAYWVHIDCSRCLSALGDIEGSREALTLAKEAALTADLSPFNRLSEREKSQILLTQNGYWHLAKAELCIAICEQATSMRVAAIDEAHVSLGDAISYFDNAQNPYALSDCNLAIAKLVSSDIGDALKTLISMHHAAYQNGKLYEASKILKLVCEQALAESQLNSEGSRVKLEKAFQLLKRAALEGAYEPGSIIESANLLILGDYRDSECYAIMEAAKQNIDSETFFDLTGDGA